MTASCKCHVGCNVLIFCRGKFCGFSLFDKIKAGKVAMLLMGELDGGGVVFLK